MHNAQSNTEQNQDSTTIIASCVVRPSKSPLRSDTTKVPNIQVGNPQNLAADMHSKQFNFCCYAGYVLTAKVCTAHLRSRLRKVSEMPDCSKFSATV